MTAFDSITPFGSILTFEENDGVFTEMCWGMKYDINGKCLNEPPNPGNIRRLEAKIQNEAIFVIPFDRHVRAYP